MGLVIIIFRQKMPGRTENFIMKKVLLLSLLLSLFSGTLLCADDAWRPGPDPNWFVKLEPALEKAKRENKFVYVLNTGSDWCGFCKMLMRDVLTKPAFAELVQKHLVPVYLDSPSKRINMPQDQRDYNRRIARNLRFGGGVPSALLLDSNGRTVGRLGGYSPQAIYITNICKQLNLSACPEFPAQGEFTLKSTTGTRENKTANVRIVAWGTSAEQVDKPLNAVDFIDVPPGKEVFFKVDYELPANFRAVLHLFDAEKNKLRSHSGLITRSGSYIFSMQSPVRTGFWGTPLTSFNATIVPQDRSFRMGSAEIPCRVRMNPGLLNGSERSAFYAKIQQQRTIFENARFEIVSWGLTRKTENPYTPGQAVRIPARRYGYVKVRYSLPEPAAFGISSDRRPASVGFNLRPLTGEHVFMVRGYRSSELSVSIRPKNGELLKNIIRIPCNIEPEG